MTVMGNRLLRRGLLEMPRTIWSLAEGFKSAITKNKLLAMTLKKWKVNYENRLLRRELLAMTIGRPLVPDALILGMNMVNIINNLFFKE